METEEADEAADSAAHPKAGAPLVAAQPAQARQHRRCPVKRAILGVCPLPLAADAGLVTKEEHTGRAKLFCTVRHQQQCEIRKQQIMRTSLHEVPQALVPVLVAVTDFKVLKAGHPVACRQVVTEAVEKLWVRAAGIVMQQRRQVCAGLTDIAISVAHVTMDSALCKMRSRKTAGVATWLLLLPSVRCKVDVTPRKAGCSAWASKLCPFREGIEPRLWVLRMRSG